AGKDRHRLLRRVRLGPGDRRTDAGHDPQARDRARRGARVVRLALWSAIAVLSGVLMSSLARAATFVYVGNTDSNDIHVLQMDRASGDLTLVEKVPIPGVTKPSTSTPMAVSPDKRFLYAGTRGEPKIAAGFAIDPASGTLKHVASGPLADSMAYIAVDRTGRYLLGASYPGHKVAVSRIDPPGTVQPAHQILEGHPNAHAILADAH